MVFQPAERRCSDSSAFNIQFVNGKPKLIDTLSFEIYETGTPWIAYRQFCEHFLAPLALMQYVDLRLNCLLKSHIGGVPLEMACRMLPMKTWLNPGLTMHLRLHAKSNNNDRSSNGADKNKKAGKETEGKRAGFSKASMMGLIQSLKDGVRSLNLSNSKSHWVNYYNETNYTQTAMSQKQALVRSLIQQVAPKLLWDVGANTGAFSRIAATLGVRTIAMDYDAACVEEIYLEAKHKNEKLILPLVMDLTQPSPSIGWSNEERRSLAERGKADLLLALALIHHLAIANNVPLAMIAKYFAELTKTLIVEFVPKADSQVQHLLSSREDIFDKYDEANFEREFSRYFKIEERHELDGSSRRIYLMRALDE